jgi:hypothetical protein
MVNNPATGLAAASAVTSNSYQSVRQSEEVEDEMLSVPARSTRNRPKKHVGKSTGQTKVPIATKKKAASNNDYRESEGFGSAVDESSDADMADSSDGIGEEDDGKSTPPSYSVVIQEKPSITVTRDVEPQAVLARLSSIVKNVVAVHAPLPPEPRYATLQCNVFGYILDVTQCDLNEANHINYSVQRYMEWKWNQGFFQHIPALQCNGYSPSLKAHQSNPQPNKIR